MPKKLAVLLAILISQFACKFSRGFEIKEVKEFEGVIKYHEIDKTLEEMDVDDTVTVYYANGNYAAFHSEKTSEFYIVKDYYLNGLHPLRLFVSNLSDTLQSLKIDATVGELQSFTSKKSNEKILSRECEAIELTIRFDDNGSVSYTDNTFLFSRGYLNVNKDHFKNWNLGFFNKVINESGTYYLKFKTVHFDSSHKNILSSKSYEVISVKEQKVDQKLFLIDTLKIK
ncbi:hypothetical protein ACXZ1K_04765 [Pedobacter sp. PWIIR3]